MLSLLIVLLSPLATLIFLPLKRKSRGFFYALSLLISSISIWFSFDLKDLEYSIEAVGFRIMVDSYARVFLVLICCTWFISIIYSYEFTKYHFQEKRERFFLFLNTLLDHWQQLLRAVYSYIFRLTS